MHKIRLCVLTLLIGTVTAEINGKSFRYRNKMYRIVMKPHLTVSAAKKYCRLNYGGGLFSAGDLDRRGHRVLSLLLHNTDLNTVRGGTWIGGVTSVKTEQRVTTQRISRIGIGKNCLALAKYHGRDKLPMFQIYSKSCDAKKRFICRTKAKSKVLPNVETSKSLVLSPHKAPPSATTAHQAPPSATTAHQATVQHQTTDKHQVTIEELSSVMASDLIEKINQLLIDYYNKLYKKQTTQLLGEAAQSLLKKFSGKRNRLLKLSEEYDEIEAVEKDPDLGKPNMVKKQALVLKLQKLENACEVMNEEIDDFLSNAKQNKSTDV